MAKIKNTGLREMIISMAYVLRDVNEGFKPTSRQWEKVFANVTGPHGVEKVHISKVDFAELIDGDLFIVYNRILIQNRQRK